MMHSRRTIIVAAAPIAAVVRPRAAKATVKGYKPPSDDAMDPVVADPVQYDIEQLMGEVDALKRRLNGNDFAFNLLAIQVMVTGVFSAWTRR